MKRFLRFVAGLIGGIGIAFAGLLLIIYFSKERLLTWLIQELGRSFSAKIYISRTQVGTLQALPSLGITLQNFILTNPRNDTLFTAQAVELHLNLWEALVKKNYRIQAILLESPKFWLIYDRKGHSAWADVFHGSSSSSEAPSPWALEKVRVKEGQFIYQDQQAGFLLMLDITDLHARIEGLGEERLHITGESKGLIAHLTHKQKTWLQAHPFSLQGTLTYEGDWLLVSPLRVQVLGLLARIEGGIKLIQPRPEVSLRIKDLDLDLQKVRRWWEDAPPVLDEISGALRGEGEILGPVGKGKLPRLRLQATLRTHRSFQMQGYPCHALYAHGRLRWEPDLPHKSALEIDSLFFAGGERDTLYARGSYGIHTARLSAAFRIRLSLDHLRVWRIPHTDSLSGYLEARGTLSQSGKKWALTGEGTLREAIFPTGAITYVAFRLAPDEIIIEDLAGRYKDFRLRIPSLKVRSYARLWDSTAAPLHLSGQMRLASFAYVPEPSGSETLPPWEGDLDIQVDSFFWGKVLYGPIRARLLKIADTFRFAPVEIAGIGGGRCIFSGVYAPTLMAGEGSFHRIDLVRLHTQMPELDTLFPLLRHMRGEATGHLRAFLPLRRGQIAWAQATGELSLSLQNLLIVESPYTYELFSLIPLTDFKRIEVGQIETRLSLSEGVLRTDTTWIRANRWTMRVAGAHTLHGELSYELLVEVPRLLLDRSFKRVEGIVEETEGERLRLLIAVTGTTAKPRFSWKPVRQTLSPSPTPKPPKPKRRKERHLPVEED